MCLVSEYSILQSNGYKWKLSYSLWLFKHLQEPVLPGCFLRAKAIGLMPMIDQVEKDDKIYFLSQLLLNLELILTLINTGRER